VLIYWLVIHYNIESLIRTSYNTHSPILSHTHTYNEHTHTLTYNCKDLTTACTHSNTNMHIHITHVRKKTTTSVAVLLKFWAQEILPKFWQNFQRNSREIFFLPPSPPQKMWEILYSALCTFYIYAEILIIPLEILCSADLN